MEIRYVPQDAFLEGCGILSRCLGFHPIHEGPPSLELIDEVTSILDGDWTLLSRFCISDESRPAALWKVRPCCCHVHDVLNFALTVVRIRSAWHGPATRRLPNLGDLEGTEHNEDVAPALDCADGSRRVRSSIAHSVDVVEQRRRSRGAKEEIGLKNRVININIYFFNG